VTLRPATRADGRALWRWRNDPATRRASFDGREVTLEKHARWIDESLARSDRRIWIVTAAGLNVGMVRLDLEGPTASVSINLAPEARGRGLGPAALRALAAEAFGPLGLHTLRARVKRNNRASVGAFRKAGFAGRGRSAIVELVLVAPGSPSAPTTNATLRLPRYQPLTDADRERLDRNWTRLQPARRRAWGTRAARRQWVFVIGCNNSGTTLLYEMLGCHPAITLLPHEGQYLTRLLPLPGAAGCPRVWTERLDVFRLIEEDDRVDADRLAYDWLSQAEHPRRRLIAEKSPPDSIRSRWLQKVFPDSFFVAIVRSGYAVAEGIHRRQGYDLRRCARHWSLANRIMLEDAERLNRFVLVKYEDLHSDLPAVAATLGAFLGLDPAPLLAFRDMELTVHNMDNAPSRLADYNARSLANLSADDLAAIEHEAAPMLDLCGYQKLAR
jgi:RimJ/RimL family protein N-acetyltransferase